jgi:pimeloyl-ACP methyl ester carboxylesterase
MRTPRPPRTPRPTSANAAPGGTATGAGTTAPGTIAARTGLGTRTGRDARTGLDARTPGRPGAPGGGVRRAPRRLRAAAVLAATAGLLASACGGGGGAHHGTAASSPTSTRTATPAGTHGAPNSDPTSDSATGSTATGSAAAPLDPLPASEGQGSAALRGYYTQKLAWHTCGAAGFQCATMRVPLDYAHPDPADDLRLAVARKKATDTKHRLGSLLVNPGGPGGSAIDYLQYAAYGFPEKVTARYDMTAVDPRGVARSAPVHCLSNKAMDAYSAVDVTPDDSAEVGKLVAADTSFAAACRKSSGALLGHVSTIDSARDMDVLRALLGDRRLAYVGKSYGTLLGATYAGLFPSRVGRLVLDGAVDPSMNALQGDRAQAGGFQTAFEAFARDCVSQSGCPLGQGSVADAGRQLSAFLKRLDAHPLPTGGSRRLTEALGTTGILSAMYDQDEWPTLRTALAKAAKGDGAGLLKLSDEYYERDTKGHYSNLMAANAAVNCLDLPPALSGPAAVRKALPSFTKTSSLFGANLAWSSLTCAYWPVHATGEPRRIAAKGAAPILVVGTTRDPATPYAWARSLAAQLSSGVLLTYNGDGHTAYARGSDCVDGAVDRYLLTGRTPARGTRCD